MDASLVNRIRYISTNSRQAGAGAPATVGFRDALFLGLAPDGGLFMPDALPSFDAAALAAFRGLSYADIAFEVLRPFTAGTLPEAELRRICAEAYDFDVPLEEVVPGTYVMRLDRGPTASFKDFAARWMARVMQALRPAGGRLTVLVATSGDTGGAVGHAFRGLEGVRVRLLYPAREVTPVQKHQMDALGQNVRTVSVDGTFDQCQALVKQAFLDPALAGLHLASANSINIGRILPQAVYYFYAWSRVARGGEAVTFSVPSGNFGNSFGGELARRMGLPVERLIVAVNENDEFPRFLGSGDYRPVVPSRACLSNAMNVGNPSNLARYFAAYGGWITREGAVQAAPDLDAMRRRLCSVSVSDAETRACMRDVYCRLGVLLEPHGAVGWVALGKCAADRRGPAVCLETAHPAKFPEIVEEVLGLRPPVPPSLQLSETAPGGADEMPADYAVLKEYLYRHED